HCSDRGGMVGGEGKEQVRSAPLNEAQLLRAAQEKTGLIDWGTDLSFRKGLSIFIDAAEQMQAPAPFYDEVRKRISHVLETRLRLVEDARQHPEILGQKIDRP